MCDEGYLQVAKIETLAVDLRMEATISGRGRYCVYRFVVAKGGAYKYTYGS